MSPEDAPEVEEVGQLSAAHLRAYTAQVDKDTVVLVIEDGELEVTINSEFGRPELAALGMERLASAAMMHAELLRRQAAERAAVGDSGV